MGIETTSADESGDEETENWERPTPRQRAWSNCVAFLATILVIVGELSSEQNMIGLVVIGGGLAVLNVLVTASSLETASEMEKEHEDNTSSFEDTALRARHSSRRRAQDMTSIDLDDLSFEDENPVHAHNMHYEEAESYSLLPRHPSRAHSYYRRWYDREPDVGDARRTRYGKTSKRTRRESRFDDEEQPAEVAPRRSKDGDSGNRKSRKQKVRRKDKRDSSERIERYRERDKREVVRRDNKHKHKKKKRVTIAPGSQEHVVITEI